MNTVRILVTGRTMESIKHDSIKQLKLIIIIIIIILKSAACLTVLFRGLQAHAWNRQKVLLNQCLTYHDIALT
jgi:hypothetical protein